jgi:hypothetical protein
VPLLRAYDALLPAARTEGDAVSELPNRATSPSEFLELWLPRAFAEAGLPPGSEGLDVSLGLLLEGEGGGEWVVRIAGGGVSVTRGSRSATPVTYVQRVADWRAAIWDGAGGAIGEGASRFFRPAALRATPETAAQQIAAAPTPAALAELAKLEGVVRMEVTGGASGDWAVAFKLGPGAIPAEASATLRMTAEDAAELASGALDPMQAFLGGKVEVLGDMTIVLQMQAAQMIAAEAAAAARG